MDLPKPLPYISGGVALIIGFIVSFILFSTTNIIILFSQILPAPLTLNPLASLGIFTLLVAIGIKLLDAPLGSGQRFRSLETKLARRQNVRDPAALAAYIERKRRN